MIYVPFPETPQVQLSWLPVQLADHNSTMSTLLLAIRLATSCPDILECCHLLVLLLNSGHAGTPH